MSSDVRVAIVDDRALFREALVALLAMQDGIVLVGDADSDEDPEGFVRATRPDVILLTVETGGVSAVTRLTKLLPRTRVVVVTMRRDTVLQGELLRAGAVGYATQNTSSSELASLIIQASLPEFLPPPPSPHGPRGLLSRREGEVLRLLAMGKSNRGISQQLSIAEGTVKRHTSNIYRRLDAGSRVEAVNRAHFLGLLPATSPRPTHDGQDLSPQ
ncbi:response regulator transcription factor [Herbiconiux sp. CPCC 203406]|uniref:response regulator transcription factor n=1 Tax=Herbiconiux oxytropis TaxID=2970915 RepID=UPI00217E0DE8|nr:response regulator transcription factor [Herbiconiux oxytropis]MCS5724053.1 response regulator transcription factor [Herbiconiux oxytropis]